MGRCNECPMRDVNCDKMVEAMMLAPDSLTLYDCILMTCREANTWGYDYTLLDERSLDERSPEMLKAGRKPETDVFKKRKDQVEGK